MTREQCRGGVFACEHKEALLLPWLNVRSLHENRSSSSQKYTVQVGQVLHRLKDKYRIREDRAMPITLYSKGQVMIKGL